jgi:hypothetical protein
MAQAAAGATKQALLSKSLSGKRFRTLLGSRGEMNSGQERADQQHQQVDFHHFLRCAVAALISLQCKMRSIIE